VYVDAAIRASRPPPFDEYSVSEGLDTVIVVVEVRSKDFVIVDNPRTSIVVVLSLTRFFWIILGAVTDTVTTPSVTTLFASENWTFAAL
jgi:hypothetical protein